MVDGEGGEIVAATPSQVNFVVPASVALGTATVSVRAAGAELANGQATIAVASPGVFVLDATNPAQPGAVENQDGSVNSPQNPASLGSIVAIYAMGYGPLDSSGTASAQVYFGDAPASVLYNGPVAGIPGLWQINARVPVSLTLGVSSLFILTLNAASNAVTVVRHCREGHGHFHQPQ